MDRIRLGMIGCGAVAKSLHLPAIASSNRVDVTALVDKHLPSARQLADSYGGALAVDDYRKIMGEVDCAIVALPNYLHASVTIDLLQHGIHVLVEKPMALTSDDCDQMIKIARNTGAVLVVGMVRRFYHSSQFVKQALERGILGNILSFDFREGTIFGWPVASDLVFRKDAAGGGVLFDIGAHLLDLLLWWLGDYKSVEYYYDDAVGGVEADCELCLRLQSGVTGIVKLSRTRNLRNTCIIRGECGTLEVGTDFHAVAGLGIRDDIVLAGKVMRCRETDQTIGNAFGRQFDNFVDAIVEHQDPFIPGQEGRRAVGVIEACYAVRQPLKNPWMFLETFTPTVLDGSSA